MSDGHLSSASGPKSLIGYRHGQLLIFFGGMLLSFTHRVNLSVAVVAMTDSSTNPEVPTVEWDSSEKGVLLGTFFYGYMAAGIPAGILVNKVSPKVIMGVAGILSGLINMGFPFIAIHLGFYACCISRVMIGFLQGSFMPGIFAHMAKWSMPTERGRFNTFIFSGNSLGSFLMLSCGGLIAASPLGWPSIFYISGISIIVWSILCLWLAVDSPREHKRISEDELISIEQSINAAKGNSKKMPIPYFSILLSIRLWASICGSFAFLWGYWVLQTMLPTYLSSVLDFDIVENGFLSALPNLSMFISSLVFPILDSFAERSFHYPLVFHRKFWNTVSLYGCAILFMVLAFIQPNAIITETILVIASTLGSGSHGGASCNVLDLTTNFAGVAGGMFNGISNLASLLAPTIAGFMIVDDSNVSGWQAVFLTCAVIAFIGNTIFLVLGSAQKQHWGSTEMAESPDKVSAS